MTGKELYEKAQNGGKGFPPWEKLPAGQKGLWSNAVREIQHEKDKLLVKVALHERESIVAFLRAKHGELTKDMEPQAHMSIYALATGMVAAAAMIDRGEHT